MGVLFVYEMLQLIEDGEFLGINVIGYSELHGLCYIEMDDGNCWVVITNQEYKHMVE